MKKRISIMKGLLLLPLFMASSFATAEVFEKIYTFGDSLSDTGNLLFVTSNNPPFIPIPPPTRYDSGRFSNGPVWIDLLALAYGITIKSSAAGFDLSVDNGISFAFGGAGTGPINLTPGGFPVPGVLGQVTIFGTALTGPTADPNALYIFWGGANDFLIPLTTNPLTTVANLKTGLDSLYQLGARNFLTLNLPDLGNTPLGQASGFANQLRALSQAHNRQLVLALIDLYKSKPGIKLYLVNIYSLVEEILSDPAAFGFSAGVVPGPASGCLIFVTAPDCSPISFETDVFFWDEQHPTTAVYGLVKDQVLSVLQSGPLIVPAIDIRTYDPDGKIRPNSNKVIYVSILSTSTAAGDLMNFAAADIDPLSVRFGLLGARASDRFVRLEDIDEDGDQDLVLRFVTEETGIACGDSAVTLTAKTVTGKVVLGTSAINIKGC